MSSKTRFVVVVFLIFAGLSPAMTQVVRPFTHEFGVRRVQPLDIDVRSLNAESARTFLARRALQTPSPALRFNFFADTSIDVDLTEVEAGGTGSPSIWQGRIAGSPYSSATFVVEGNAITGSVTRGDGMLYQIRTTEDGTHWAIEIDQSQFPEGPDAPVMPISNAEAHAVPSSAVAATGDDGSTIDVLVLYTAAARIAAGGTTAMQQRVLTGIVETNTAYANSGIIQSVRLVRAQETTYVESSSLGTDLNYLTNAGDGYLDEAQPLRDAWGADVVSLWVESSDNSCGIAWVLTSPSAFSAAAAPYGYSVTQQSCAVGNYTFGHEMGHNMGAHHAKSDLDSNGNPPVGAYSYSNGYKQISGALATHFRTVMAYDDAPCNCPRIQYFSNPLVQYTNAPVGIDPNNLAQGADNALTLNNTRVLVANFRATVAARGPTDIYPPLLLITSPTANANFLTSTVTVTGTASDNGWGDNGIQSVTVNGVPATNSAVATVGTANWSATVSLNSGTNTITVVATDGSPAHNSSTASITVTRLLPVSATAATYHVFPQYADGVAGDGSYYRTTLMLTNTDNTVSASCTFRLYGLTQNGSNTFSYTAIAGGWVIAQSPGTQALKTGYATLTCSSKVEAQLLYSLYAASGTKLSEATVFSSPSAGLTQILGDNRNGSRIGLAFANDTDQPETYTIYADDINGEPVGSAPVALNPRTSIAQFVDQWMTLPASYYGQVFVSTSGTASIIGLRYTGNAFTTIPETIRSSVGATANTYHVFPQFAEGVLSDGSSYNSTLMLSNPSASVTVNCTMTLKGLTSGGTNTFSYPLSQSGWNIATFSTSQAFMSGYATVSCSAPVEAQLLYSYYSSSGTKLSEATVFSSPSSTSVEVLSDGRESARLGLALANDSDQQGDYTVTAYDANGFAIASLPHLMVAPRTSQAQFVDQLVALPAGTYGLVTVQANSGSASIIGLRFTGTVFTTIPESFR